MAITRALLHEQRSGPVGSTTSALNPAERAHPGLAFAPSSMYGKLSEPPLRLRLARRSSRSCAAQQALGGARCGRAGTADRVQPGTQCVADAAGAGRQGRPHQVVQFAGGAP